ncbi:Ig-like domain-containing protein [Endothiovibrio diazotrophicus]
MTMQSTAREDDGHYLERIAESGTSADRPDGVTLPDAGLLLRGDYSRDGDDLRITGPDGIGHTVEGYFAGASHPTLYAPGGAGLTFDTVAKLVGAHAAGYGAPLMVAGPPPAAEAIGSVKSLRGVATAKGADGQVRPLAEGDPIYLNDTVQTADGAFLRILFDDGTAFFLGRNARAVIDGYVYQPEAGLGSFAASVTLGFFRYISGKLGKLGHDDHPYATIKTPTATIGIRGSDIEGEVDAQGNTTLVHHSGIIDVADINGLGMVTLLEPGTATLVSPEGVAAIFEAPPEMIQRFQESLPPPSNGETPQGQEPPTGEIPAATHGEGKAPAAPGHGGPAGERGAEGRAAEPEGEGRGEGNEGERAARGERRGEEGDTAEERDGPPGGEEGEGLLLDAAGRPLFQVAREGGDGHGDGPELEGPRAFAGVEGLAPLDGRAVPGGEEEEGPPPPLVGLPGAAAAAQEPMAELLENHPLADAVERPEAVEESDVVQPLTETLAAVDDEFDTAAGEVVSGNVLDNDLNHAPDRVHPFILGHTAPAHGTLEVERDGDFVYTPEAGFQGTDRFTYVLSDGLGGHFPAEVEIEVGRGNPTPPGSIDDFAHTDAGHPTSGNLLSNDGGALPAGATPTVVDYTQPVGGAVQVAQNGDFTYTPGDGFSGIDTFSYTADDGLGGRYTAQVTIDVEAEAVTNAGLDEYYQVTADTPLQGDLLENDQAVAAAGANPRVTGHDEPSHGSVVVAADGTFTYTPEAGFVGSDGFSYVVDDGLGGSLTSFVGFDIGGSGQAPAEVGDVYQIDGGTALSANVLDNDGALLAAGATPSVTFGQPLAGTLQAAADGQFTYTPEPGFSGHDYFIYSVDDGLGGHYDAYVDIDVGAGVNAAGGDDLYATPLATPLGGNLFDNDRMLLPAGGSLTLISYTQPAGGAVVVNDDGSFAYTPNAAFSGVDTFTYVVDDGLGAQHTAQVTIDVGGVQPGADPANNLPVTGYDFYSVARGTQASGNVLGNDTDPDGDPLTAQLQQLPNHGLAILTTGGDFTYAPEAGFVGNDFFSYTAEDGRGGIQVEWVEIEVGGGTATPADGGNSPPVAGDDNFSVLTGTPLSGNVLTNDQDPNGDPLSVTLVSNPLGNLALTADGQFTYTPLDGFSGEDAFQYQVDDGQGGSTIATVHLLVDATAPTTNVAPHAGDDLYIGAVDVPIIANVLDNDHDPNGDLLDVIGFSQPAHGTLTIANNGEMNYLPAAGYSGTDSFSYTIDDGFGHTATATVSLNIA